MSALTAEIRSSKLAGYAPAVIACLAGCVALGVGAARYYPFIADDTLISLRYADRLLSGRGLTWDDYHPVEGFSNLLWTLSTAALGLLKIDLITASRVVCLSSAVGCLVVMTLAALQRERAGALGAWLACGFFALSGDVQVWSLGGLEQTQLALILLSAMLSHMQFHRVGERRWLQLSAALHFALVLTRPDSVLFCGVSVVAAWFLPTTRRRLHAVIWLAAASTLAFVLKLALSRLYYGEWLPNTAYIKLALTMHRIQGGFDYLTQFSRYKAGLLISLLAYLGWILPRASSTTRRELLYLALAGALWAAYVVMIGGDIFPAHRHGVSLSALACCAFAVAERPESKRGWQRALVLASVLPLGWHAYLQWQCPQNVTAVTERWEHPCGTFASRLGAAFYAEQPLIGVYAAGCMAYHSRLPAIDMLGLNDWRIARNPPPDLGMHAIGHEFGHTRPDAEYVWERNPALFFHHIGKRRRAFWRELISKEFPLAKKLMRRYREIKLRHGSELAWAWLSRDSALALPRHEGNTVVFPALALEPAARGGIPEVRLEEHAARYIVSEPSKLHLRELEPGSYQLQVDASGGELAVKCNGGESAVVAVADKGISCKLVSVDPGSPALVRSVRVVASSELAAQP